MKIKLDIGLMWGKAVNIWGQAGLIIGVANTLMMVGVFYTTVVQPIIKVPFWLYIVIIVLFGVSILAFILKLGISGYYRFFSQQTELKEMNEKISLVMEHLGIEYQKSKKR